MKGKGKGSHPNSKKALEPTKWKKGQAVPGAGRPKGSLGLKEKLAEILSLNTKTKMPNGTVMEKTVLEAMLLAVCAQGAKGNVQAVKEILDRYYGKEVQTLDIMTKEKIDTTISMEERIQKYAK